jgi:hypothetical protein
MSSFCLRLNPNSGYIAFTPFDPQICPKSNTNEAQKTLPDLIDSVSQSHQPILIAGKGGNAVLLSQPDWSVIQETLICCRFLG